MLQIIQTIQTEKIPQKDENMNANSRIQWLHKKIVEGCYPNAMRSAEKFGISHRQAQRDFDFLKKQLGAPLEYCPDRKGYRYSAEFSLPLFISSENDSDYFDVVAGIKNFNDAYSSKSVIQLQLPYSAVLEIKDKLTAMNMRSFIVSEDHGHRYTCEFQSIELFLGVIVSMDSEIRIVSPDWLRERLVSMVGKILESNK